MSSKGETGFVWVVVRAGVLQADNLPEKSAPHIINSKNIDIISVCSYIESSVICINVIIVMM